MPKKLEARPVFEDLNQTELWQMARRVGIAGACQATPREYLVEALETLEDIPMTDPTEGHRTRFVNWLGRNWDRLQMQMQGDHCPNCDQSCDVEFADCWLDNQHRVS